MFVLQPECELALRRAVSAACDQVFSLLNDGRVCAGKDGPLSVIAGVVHSEYVKSAHAHNSLHSRALRLPSELLRAILELLPVRERLLVAGVCQKWKDVAYACSVSVSLPNRVEGITALAERLLYVTPAPLCISPLTTGLEGSDGAIARFDFLRDHMWRIRDLHLHFDSEDLLAYGRTRSAIFAALSAPAPQLRRLVIRGTGIERLGPLADSWFDGQAPNLARCSISAVAPSSRAFHATRTIVLHEDDILLKRARAAFCTCPYLENLYLRSWGWNATGQRLSIPASLRNLWIEGSSEVLEHIDHAQIPNIYLLCSDRQHNVAAATHGLSTQLATQVDVHVSSNGAMSYRTHTLRMRTRDTALRCRAIALSSYEPFDLGGMCFDNVTMLSLEGLHRSAVRQIALPAVLPALQRLTIVCEAVRAEPHLEEAYYRLPRLCFACPLLEHLVLTRSADDVHTPPSYLLAGDVAAFVSENLGSASNSLASLTIRGAQVLDAENLQGLASRIDVDVAGQPFESWVDSIAFQSVWGAGLM